MRALLLAALLSAPSYAASKPDWVQQGSGEFTSGGTRRLQGVGSVFGVRNRALRIATADNRAKAELAILLSERGVAPADYKRIIDDINAVDHWDDEDGGQYSLVTYDPARLGLASKPGAAASPPAPASPPAFSAPAPAPPSVVAPSPAPAAPVTDAAAVRRIVEEALQQAQQKKPAAAVRSDVDAPSYRIPERADDFALVVGAEKYAVGLPDAAFAERDATAMREHLLALGFPSRNVVMLTGERASRAGLAKNLEAWLARNVNERSSVFFYYSGHGAPDPRTGDAYLVPTDGDPQYLEETAYSLKRLYQKLGALKAKSVVVALDSCFSGSGGRSVLPKGVRPLVNRVQLGVPTAGKVISLSASEASQISGSLDEQGHGLFTYFLLKGLNGAAADTKGSVTLRGLHAYLTPKVQDEARRQNREQTPQLHGADVRLR